jgi:hypothetical protein
MADRIACRFSCGAASAVATKLALADYGHERVEIVNAYIKEEHPDNGRFLSDCERWFEHPIRVLRNEKYNASTHEIWKRRRYMAGRFTAICSIELKREVMDADSLPNDIFVLGYTADEEDRLDRFIDANNGRKVLTPLIDRNLKHADCLAIIERAGIELPAMYRLGFNNNNCIGCVKGGEKYWKKIRSVFPEQFIQIAEIQKAIGPGAYLFRNRKTGERWSLYDLPPDDGRNDKDEPEITCSFFCEMAEQDMRQETEQGNG